MVQMFKPHHDEHEGRTRAMVQTVGSRHGEHEGRT